MPIADDAVRTRVHIQRLRVLREAERLSNVSEACRRHGMSRTLFYRLRGRLEQYGPDGVHPKRRQARRGRPPGVPVPTERRVIAFALAWPTCGPQWFSDQLAREGLPIAPVTIWPVLRRCGLGTRRARLAVLEQHSAETAGLLAGHEQPEVRAAIEQAGARLRFLPPYSPDLNPIEQAFAKLKAFFRAFRARTSVGGSCDRT